MSITTFSRPIPSSLHTPPAPMSEEQLSHVADDNMPTMRNDSPFALGSTWGCDSHEAAVELQDDRDAHVMLAVQIEHCAFNSP